MYLGTFGSTDYWPQAFNSLTSWSEHVSPYEIDPRSIAPRKPCLILQVVRVSDRQSGARVVGPGEPTQVAD